MGFSMAAKRQNVKQNVNAFGYLFMIVFWIDIIETQLAYNLSL